MSSKHTTLPAGRRNIRQSGMVSIMVTLIMMLVITLIVLGFAQISRREQRQSLDRQLSSQAFFAAESGVNDARDEIAKKLAANAPVEEKKDCGVDPTNYPANPIIAPAVSYTCLLVQTKLKNLTIDPLTPGAEGVVLPIEADGDMHSLRIDWNTKLTTADVTKCASSVPTAGLSGSGSFPKSNGGWTCPYAVLRAEIVSTNNLNRAALATSRRTFFIYPTNTSADAVADYGGVDGATERATCDAGKGCAFTLAGLPDGTYALNLRAIYTTASVLLVARDNRNEILNLKNAQILIDSTGKAQDVLRRIQVRLPVSTTSAPSYPLQSASSICKRFEYGSVSNSFRIPNDIAGQDQNNPMCRPMSVTP